LVKGGCGAPAAAVFGAGFFIADLTDASSLPRFMPAFLAATGSAQGDPVAGSSWRWR